MKRYFKVPPPMSRALIAACMSVVGLSGCTNTEAEELSDPADTVTGKVTSGLQVTYYDFIAQAPGAYWHNNGGGVAWGTNVPAGAGGCYKATSTMEDGVSRPFLMSQPKWQSNGFMHAAYTVTVPVASAHPNLTATFGFTSGIGQSLDGVTFGMTTPVNGQFVSIFNYRKSWTGGLTTITADLSAYAGQTIQLFLTADAGSDVNYDRSAWTDLRVIADNVAPPVNGCSINGAAYNNGDANPAVSCQVCDPQVSTSAWSVRADSCLIAGTCYAADETDAPGCNRCDPLTSQTSWSSRSACDNIVIATTTDAKIGDFNGHGSNGDAWCAAQGAPLGLPGTWKAMLSTTTSNLKDIVPAWFSSTPVVNLQGQQLYSSWSSIFTNQVWPSGLSMYQFGTSSTALAGAAYTGTVWTGTGTNGMWHDSTNTYNCQNWTNNGFNFPFSIIGPNTASIGNFATTSRSLLYTANNADCLNVSRRITCVLVPTAPQATVQNYDGTAEGILQSKSQGDSWAYLGVPYAGPPTGGARLAPPTKVTSWVGVRNAYNQPVPCAQAPFLPTGGYIGSEDCLYLNIWTPKSATPTSNLPVIVFHHGGGFVFGGTAAQDDWVGTGINDGDRLAAAQNVVVVTLQTRLAALGYLADPALSANATSQTSSVGGGTSGNYGLLDAQQALKWIKRNISKFGGDPNHVMFSGQSAGATLAASLIASPLGKDPADNKPYFASAWLMSGFYEQPTMATRYAQANAKMAILGCDTAPDRVACLRSAPLQNFVNAAGATLAFAPGLFNGPTPPETGFGLTYGPNIDGSLLPAQPRVTIAAGQHNKIPVVIGNTKDEANTFMVLSLGGIATFNFTNFVVIPFCINRDIRVQNNLGATLAATVGSMYPCDSFDILSPTITYAQGVTDAQYVCPARRMARALVAGQTQPVRRYLFTHWADHWGAFQNLFGLAAKVGAAHALDLAFVFDSHDTMLGYFPSAYELDLTSRIQRYWRAMAATGNPNYTGGAAWAAYDRSLDNTLNLKDVKEYWNLLDPGPEMFNGVNTAKCDFWDDNYTLDGWK